MDQAHELRKMDSKRFLIENVAPGLRCIAVGSGKGGVGKTAVSIAIACCLAKRKYRTLLIDADLGLANVDLQMGIEPVYTLQDIVYGSCSLEDAVISTREGPDVLASGSGSPDLVDMGSARRHMLINELINFASRYDFLIIDVGAGIGKVVTTFLSASPEVAIVLANEPTSIMDAYSLIKVLRQVPHPPSMTMIINMVQSIEEGEKLGGRLNEITYKFLGVKIPIAGIINYDFVVGDAIRARKPLVTYAAESGPAKCMDEIALYLINNCKASSGVAKQHFFDKLADVSLKPRRDMFG